MPAKGRYLDTPQPMGLEEDGDLYAAHNEEKFTDDMSLWHPVDYRHICYFIDHPVCTLSISYYNKKA